MRFLKLLLLISAVGFAQQNPKSNVSYVVGRFVAYNYGQWRLPIQQVIGTTPGVATIVLQKETVNLSDGTQIMPINTNAPIVVGTETVTPSSTSGCVYNNPQIGSCRIVATFTHAQPSSGSISSGTFGLQEALNAAINIGGVVTVDNLWNQLGGTSGMISAAVIPVNTGIEDIRTGVPVSMVYPPAGMAKSSGSAWIVPSYADLIALFHTGGGACVGYTKNDGTCDVPSCPTCDILTQANTHTTGTQTVLTGATNRIGTQVQGAGVVVPGYLAQGHDSTGIGPVAVGQYILVFAAAQFGTPSTPSDTYGNTFSLLASNSGPSSTVARLFGTPITHSGTADFINCPGYDCYYVSFSNINGASPVDVVGLNGIYIPSTTGTDNLSGSLTTTVANDLLVELTGIYGTGGTCAWGTPAGFTANHIQTTNGFPVQIATMIATAPTLYSPTWTGNCQFNNFGNETLIALKTTSTFTQGTDLTQYLDANANVLSHISGPGAFNPPQSAGTPGNISDPGTVWYNTSSKHSVIYDQQLGYINVAYDFTGTPTVGSGTLVGDNTGGYVTGLSAASSLTLTFASGGWPTWASCIGNSNVSGTIVSVTSTAGLKTGATFAFSPALTGSLNYYCYGQ